MLLYYNRLKA